MPDSDLNVVAPLLVQYYQWLSGNGGTDPAVLLSQRLTASQRRLLLDRMDDVNVVWGFTAPLRAAVEREQQVQVPSPEQRRSPRSG